MEGDFWLVAWKDPAQSRSPRDSWDSSSAGERIGIAKWIRSWDDATAILHAKETVASVDAMVSKCLPSARRWAADVVLDVFGDIEDLAATMEMSQRPRFKEGLRDLSQFDRLTRLSDLWGEGGRSEELDHAEAKIVTRWVVASALAELLHSRLSGTEPTASLAFDRVMSLRRRATRRDEADEDDEWDEDVDVPEVAPLPAGPKPKTDVGAYFKEKEAERVRHDKGYDVFDKAMAKLKDESRAQARELLLEYVDAMKDHCFEIEFSEKRLGFSVALHKFGKLGRNFVAVDETTDDRLLAGDEVVSINGAMVVDPSEGTITLVKRFIDDAPRPLVVKFVRGERPDDDREIKSNPPPPPEVLVDRVLATRDIDGALRLVVRADGTVRKVQEYFAGAKRARRERSKRLGQIHEGAAYVQGKLAGYARGGGPLVDIVAADDMLAGFVDMGSGRILDAAQSTRFHIDPAGNVKRDDGLHCGTVDDFHYSKLKPIALILVFLKPDLFKLPKGRRNKGIARILRKTTARLTGVHGYFG